MFLNAETKLCISSVGSGQRMSVIKIASYGYGGVPVLKYKFLCSFVYRFLKKFQCLRLCDVDLFKTPMKETRLNFYFCTCL